MYRLNESGIRSEQHHQDLRTSEDERVARPKSSDGTGRPGTRRLRVVPAPGGFAFVED